MRVSIITIIIFCSFLATEDLFAGDIMDLEMCDASRDFTLLNSKNKPVIPTTGLRKSKL